MAWILAQGIWNDGGVWDDNARWIDSYDGVELLSVNSGITESISKNSAMDDTLEKASEILMSVVKDSNI